jgi:Protein of unknown function (DUF2569)
VRRFFILLSVLLFYFTSPANGNLQSASHSKINWITIWLSFFFGVLFTILFRFLNKKSKAVDQRSDAAMPLSGWVLFLGFNLIVRFGIQSYFFWESDYFMQSTWLSLGQAGGTKFQSLFIFELFLSLFSLTGTGALLYWFFGRRDVFPFLFICYVGFYVVATLVLLFIYRSISIPANMLTIRHDSLIQIFRILYAVAWFGYLLKSDQVRQTFVYPPN